MGAHGGLRAHLQVVDLARDEEGERRCELLLEERGHLACRVELRAEGRHAELVAGRERRERVSPPGGGDDLEVGRDVDLVAQLLPVRRLEDAGALQLRGRDPALVRARVLCEVRRRDVGHVRGLALEDALDAEREVFGDGLQVGADVDPGQVPR